MEDIAEEELLVSLASKIADKIVHDLSPPIDDFKSSITKAKDFLDATSQKHASELLNLQELTKGNTDLSKSLADTSEKIGQVSNPRNLSDTDWPLSHPGNPTPRSTHLASLVPSSSPAIAKIQQCTILATKQLMIEYGPLAEGETPKERSNKSQRALHDLFNNWLTADSDPTEKEIPRSPLRVRSITIFEQPAILLEFDSAAGKEQFATLCNSNTELLVNSLGPNAHIKPRNYPIIFCFVPCDGSFDPSSDNHLREMEIENNLEPNAIASASWCKHPENRSPNQTSATLKVMCANPETANHLLKEQIRVSDHLVNVRKDLRQPIRCIKCQEYGHIRDACINTERCGKCASERHSTNTCSTSNPPKCVSCR
jgi:hypothetical protein